MELLFNTVSTVVETIVDVAPIVAVLILFQVAVIRQPVPNPRRMVTGIIFVVIGLSLFIVGLREALFPLGEIMARQLTAPDFIGGGGAATLSWRDYGWVYVFAAAIGFATTIAEPSLIAVALKARQVSGGTISIWGLRLAVAVGVALGVGLGTFRIVTGTPLVFYIIAAYVGVIALTLRSGRTIIPLAYDSGGVTTSTVTVPLVTALGLGLASTVPGRSPVIDGFGLIAFASVFPIITVLGYAQIGIWLARLSNKRRGSA
jgi:hypothetical protein